MKNSCLLSVFAFLFVVEISAQECTLYTIGDSTMANKTNPEENPERGWGQMLPLFFNSSVRIENHAVNGRSTRSFLDEGKWDVVRGKLKPGDFVFIQFGHNDQKSKDPKRYTNPYTAYRNNLLTFVQETKKVGAHPILLSSIVRRNFNEQGTLVDTHGVYPMVMQQVAEETQTPFIDLQYLTELLEESYGVEQSKLLHLHFNDGEHPYYPKGKQDNTHLSVLGATEVSKLVVQELLKMQIPLSLLLK